MAFAAGTRLGTYEITALLGAGGMGEVYRARDARLGREVAIKTLSSDLAQDTDRLARFDREATLLAALNHAHIAVVHGLDEHEGTKFLVMELVEGEPLEERLKRGPLPVDQALELALQIAGALEAAHEKGVIHRDLKPANVMVTQDDIVKVLDFGLAKVLSGDSSHGTPAHSPALSLAMTQQGLVLGTAGYMSPEQASGQATDQRADVWAFGVVLYEMLTGESAFSGESVPHILAAVLQTEPEWDRLPATLSPRIRQLLARCLEKKPRNRYHSIADVRIEIEAVQRDPDSSGVYFAIEPARNRAVSPWIAAITLATVFAAYAGWLGRGANIEPAAVRRFEYVLPTGQSFPTTIPQTSLPQLSISPDGNNIVYVADRQLYLWDLGSAEPEAVPLAGTQENPSSPIVSPDGQWVAFYSVRDGRLKKVPLEGGVPIPLADAIVPHGMSWTADGILYAQADGIHKVSADGGDQQLVIQTSAGEQAGDPQLLPDGENVLFSLASGISDSRWNEAQIMVASLGSGDRTRLGLQGSAAKYVPTGHLVYLSEAALFAVPFDSRRLEARAGRRTVLSSVARGRGNRNTPPSDNYAFSDAGDLIYIPQQLTSSADQSLMMVTRSGEVRSLARNQREYLTPRVSPDGTRLVVQVRDPTSGTYLRMIDLQTGTGSQFTFESGAARPNWTADGRQVVYRVPRAGGSAILMRQADGAGVVETLYEGDDLWPTSVSAGMVAFYEVDRQNNDRDIMMLDINAGTLSEFRATQANERNPRFSPSGRWVAYVSDELGIDEVWIRPAPGFEGPVRRVSEGGGVEPAWAADGKEIYYRDPAGNLVAAGIVDTSMLTVLPPEPLFSLDGRFSLDETATWTSYDVHSDGGFVMISSATGIQSDRIVYIQNWFEQLKEQVPLP